MDEEAAVSRGRDALLIATSRYDHAGLRRLRSPARDGQGLAEVLRDPRIGDFEVTQVVDARQHEANRTIEEFFLDRGRNDLLLLHLSCHGLKNDSGELFFAARDTDPRLLASTAVSASFLRSQMQRCRAKSIVVLLDCCYSGAFLPGSKGDNAVHLQEELAGHGRVVITATSRTEYAWEGDHFNELGPEPSQFTGAVIEGLRTGRADVDKDGLISVLDLYDYVAERMRASGVKQRPQLWTELEYRVILGRSVLRTTKTSPTARAMAAGALAISVTTESETIRQWVTEGELRSLVERIGGTEDHFLVVERIPAKPDVYIQVWHDRGGDYQLEYRDGAPDRHVRTFLPSSQAVTETMLRWARQEFGWHVWERVDDL
ncbi:caspase domain-containing protein [Streptomyces sp. NPDC051963]|uniref:caspase domain-containing protein n=1 Tax=Streptomyces sp. NPDC051963 TaxID=3365678 RepID=UPI0037D5196D